MPRTKPTIVCGTRKPNGQPCRLPAGWGTDHFGTGPCIYHDGSPHGRGQHPPLVQLADPELRPIVLRMLQDDSQLFDIRFELATLRAHFARAAASSNDPRLLMDLAKTIATVMAKLREAEVGRHYYIHVNVVGLVLQAVGEVAAQYLHTEAERRQFHDDLQSVLRGLLPSATTQGIAASALVQPIIAVSDEASGQP